ncbi:MAG: DUF5302 domain-containing protein [Actinomycetota bacterium]
MTEKSTSAKKAAPAKKTTAAKKPAAPAQKATAKKAAPKKAAESTSAPPPEPEPEPQPEPSPERFHSDDPKEMFRHALEQKKKRSGFGSEAHLSGGSAKPGKSGKAGGKREFRRKSG